MTRKFHGVVIVSTTTKLKGFRLIFLGPGIIGIGITCSNIVSNVLERNLYVYIYIFYYPF